MRIRIVPLMTGAALAVAVAAVPVHAAGIPKTNKCGNVATGNGGKAQYIRAYKTSCTNAKAVARRARGKKFTARGFTCQKLGATYLCNRSGSKQTIVFTYKKP